MSLYASPKLFATVAPIATTNVVRNIPEPSASLFPKQVSIIRLFSSSNFSARLLRVPGLMIVPAFLDIPVVPTILISGETPLRLSWADLWLKLAENATGGPRDRCAGSLGFMLSQYKEVKDDVDGLHHC